MEILGVFRVSKIDILTILVILNSEFYKSLIAKTDQKSKFKSFKVVKMAFFWSFAFVKPDFT